MARDFTAIRIAQQFLEVLRQPVAHVRIAGEHLTPFVLRQKSQMIDIAMLGVAQHQIAFQVFVEPVGLARHAHHAPLELMRKHRQQQSVDLAGVGIARGVAERAPLVKTGAHAQRNRSFVRFRALHHGAPGIQPRQKRLYAGARGHLRTRKRLCALGDLRNVVRIGPVAHQQPDQAQQQQNHTADVRGALRERFLQLQAAIDAGQSRIP